MAEFTVLNTKWNNDKIKDMFNVSDDVLNNEDRFYYITSEGKLAYLETKATNKAETIAKVFYTLGMIDSDRTAKEQIACGIICCKDHLNKIIASSNNIKYECVRVLANDIKELVDEINDKFETLSELLN